MRSRARTVATVAAMAGLLVAAGGIQATSASWSDAVAFEIQASVATTTTTTSSTTTTTTLPSTTTTVKPSALVRVTSICRGDTTFTLRVINSSLIGPLSYNVQVGGTVIWGPNSIAAGEIQFFEIPNGTNGVTAIPVDDWTNTYSGTASTPTTPCEPEDSTTTTSTTTTTSSTTTSTTTTTAPPTTTTQPPPASVSEGGISAANSDTVISDIVWKTNEVRQPCVEVRITGATAVAEPWAVRVNLAVAPWYAMPTSQFNVQGTGIVAVESPSSVVVTGKSHGGGFDPRQNSTPIDNTRTAILDICNYNAPVPPPADPGWYTVSQTQGTWTDTQACMVVTATGTKASPFFYGWSTTLDLTAAKARISGVGRTLGYVGWSPSPNGDTDFDALPRQFNPPQDTYVLTSGYNTALRGGTVRTLTACVYGW